MYWYSITGSTTTRTSTQKLTTQGKCQSHHQEQQQRYCPTNWVECLTKHISSDTYNKCAKTVTCKYLNMYLNIRVNHLYLLPCSGTYNGFATCFQHRTGLLFVNSKISHALDKHLNLKILNPFKILIIYVDILPVICVSIGRDVKCIWQYVEWFCVEDNTTL